MVKSIAYKQLNDYIDEMYDQKNIHKLLAIRVNEFDLYFEEMQLLRDKIDRKVKKLSGNRKIAKFRDAQPHIGNQQLNGFGGVFG